MRWLRLHLDRTRLNSVNERPVQNESAKSVERGAQGLELKSLERGQRRNHCGTGEPCGGRVRRLSVGVLTLECASRQHL